MYIETIDDILNELADKLGVYGCCDAAAKGKDVCYNKNPLCCRVGFCMEYSDRIKKAIQNENKFYEILLTGI